MTDHDYLSGLILDVWSHGPGAGAARPLSPQQLARFRRSLIAAACDRAGADQGSNVVPFRSRSGTSRRQATPLPPVTP